MKKKLAAFYLSSQSINNTVHKRKRHDVLHWLKGDKEGRRLLGDPLVFTQPSCCMKGCLFQGSDGVRNIRFNSDVPFCIMLFLFMIYYSAFVKRYSLWLFHTLLNICTCNKQPNRTEEAWLLIHVVLYFNIVNRLELYFFYKKQKRIFLKYL